jgi:hypothetical protein
MTDPAPAFEAVEGPSFPVAIKSVATVLTASVVVWGALTIDELAQARLEAGPIAFLVAVLLVVGTGYWGILTSRTGIDGEFIRQRWLWTKEVRIADITSLKLIHVPGLAWLMVPRLMVRARGTVGMTTFPSADPRVIAAFRRLGYGET